MRIATGKARWLNGSNHKALKDGKARLMIASDTLAGTIVQEYNVARLKSAFILQQDSGRKYLVHEDYCSCPDAHKGNVCKHVKAIKAAIPLLPS